MLRIVLENIHWMSIWYFILLERNRDQPKNRWPIHLCTEVSTGVKDWRFKKYMLAGLPWEMGNQGIVRKIENGQGNLKKSQGILQNLKKKYKFLILTWQLKMQTVSAILIVIYIAILNWFLNQIFNSFEIEMKRQKNLKLLLLKVRKKSWNFV